MTIGSQAFSLLFLRKQPIPTAPQSTPPAPAVTPASQAFPNNVLNMSIQILINGTWTDITSFVYERDDITIEGRGRPNWTQTLNPSDITITLNNVGGNFSPTNINGLFYPYITRNTQLRISVNVISGTGVTYSGYRFWGEVSDWPPQWDETGADVFVSITASGVMRRYIQGGLIGSPIKRFYLLKTDATTPVALWTMEDLSGSSQFANQINNVDSMTWTGTPTLASDSTSFQGADPLPLVSMATISGFTGSYSANGVALFTTPGTYFWTCPGSVSSVAVACWGGGAGASNYNTFGANTGSGGAGGGEYAAEAAVGVTPGNNYVVVVGAGGAGAVFASQPDTQGTSGGLSSFTGDHLVVLANPGQNQSGSNAGLGGTGSTNTTHFNGGNGGFGGSGSAGGGVTNHTQTWNAVHTYSYEGINADSNPDPGFSPGALVNTDGNALQGDDQLGDNGNTSCVILLPYASIQAAMSGYTGINFAKLTLRNLHSWYNAGMTVAIGSTNYTGAFGASRQFGTWGVVKDNYEAFIGEGATKTFSLPGFYFAPLASAITGLVLYHATSDRNFYGYFAGGTSPSLQMQWTTGNPNSQTGSGGGGGSAGGSTGAGAAGSNGGSLQGGPGGAPGPDPDGFGGNGGSYPFNGAPGGAPGGGGGGGSYLSTAGGNGAAGQVQITYTPSATPNNVVARFALSVPPTDAVNLASLVRVLISSGSLTYIECYYGTGGKIGFHGYNGATLKFDSGLLSFGAVGQPMMVSMELAVSGTGIAWQIRAVVPGGTSYIAPAGNSGTLASSTIGAASEVVINPAGTLNDTTVGIVVVQYALEDMITTGLANCLNGHSGELAGDRFVRLCAEEGIGGTLRGFNTDTPAMGPQRNMSFTDTLQQIEDADQGLLIEARDMLGLYYRTRASISNQQNPVIFDYSLAVFSGTVLPIDDDQLTRNDITVSRVNGVSTNVILTTGPLSIQAPPNGVGDYSYSIDSNFLSDTQVTPMANWLLAEGTAGGQRYENLEIDLTRLSNQNLFSLVPSMDCGDFFQIINTPYWLPIGPVEQLAWGFSEVLNTFKWTFNFNSVPQQPYDTDFLDTGNSGSSSNSGFEGSSGSTGTWQAISNCSLYQSNVTAHSGSWSMVMQSNAAGSMTAHHTSDATAALVEAFGLPVTAGETVYVSAMFQAAVSPRSCNVQVDWYNISGVYQSTSTGNSITDNVTGWTEATISANAPVAGYAIAKTGVLGTGGAAEKHYVDDVHMIGGWW